MSTSPATPPPRQAPQALPGHYPGHGHFPLGGAAHGHTHPGCLVITTVDGRTGKPRATAYLVSPVLDYGRLAGWTLKKADGKVYDLPADLSSCDCPDGTYHPERPGGGCKHRKALAKALQALAV
jgi:hypothetical protein